MKKKNQTAEEVLSQIETTQETPQETAQETAQEQPTQPVKEETAQEQPTEPVKEETTQEQPTEPVKEETTQEQPTEPVKEETPQEQPQEVKKKRGRPKGYKVEGKNEVEDLFSQIENSPQTLVKAPEQNAASVAISGKLLLIVIDSVVPMGISFIVENQTEYSISVEDIKLTATERKELEPIADEVAKLMFSELPPVPLFFVSYAVITFSKVAISLKRKNNGNK